MGPRWLIVALAGAIIASCGGGDPEPPAERAAQPPPSEPQPPPDDGEPPTVGDGRGGVELEPLAELDQPLGVAQAPGEEAIHVVEQCGRIVRLEGDEEASTFLDLSDSVSCGGERGLLSVAFAPDHERSGLLYINYTGTDGETRIVELRRSEDDPLVAEPGSARELLVVDQPFSNHNGGLIEFGPDGNLYIATGDGGAADDPLRAGQDLGTLLGKLLRIDPRPRGERPYRVPADNPFVDEPGARPEILAYGLRNPWRFSFDRETGDLWVADVGQNELEEVNGPIENLGEGANFGWSAYEGTSRFNADQEAPDAVEPALVYPIDGRECAITGGYVVRDPDLPSLYGRYLYGDFCAGELRSFEPGPGGARDDRALGLEVPSLSAFGEDEAGRIYATSLDGGVFRLRAAEG